MKELFNNDLNSLEKILNAKISDFIKIEGIQEKLANKLFNNIQNGIKNIELAKLFTASNLFGKGFGIKKFNIILKKYPNILKMNIEKKNLINLIKNLDGYEEKTSLKFVEGLSKFKKFLKNLPNITYITNNKKESKKFNNINIVFTGFRNIKLENKIINNGGNVNNNINKNTNYLIIPKNNYNENTSKLIKANELKINIISEENFINKYNIKF